MGLLDRATLAARSNQAAYLDTGTYPDPYLNGVLSAVDAAVERYIHFRPYLSQHQNEEGPAQYLESGVYAGRYLIELVHRPLVPGPASAIFTTLQLTYALALSSPSDVPLEWVTVEHSTGRALALAPGFVDALAGVGFASAPTPGLHALGYVASYAAGWATGLADPTPPAGGSYNAEPVPEDLRYAAALLAQEALAVQAAQNANTAQPFAGILSGVRVGEREERYRPLLPTASPGGAPTLGYGGPLAQQAQSILDRYRRTPIGSLV